MRTEGSEAGLGTDAPGRRERKKQATRQALHEAAWALVEERGFANVTIEAITDRVDVAARTFFNHYSSKEEAVLGRDSDRMDRICSGVAARLAAGDLPLDALHDTMRVESSLRGLSSEEQRRRLRLLNEEPGLFSCAAGQWEDLNRRLAQLIADATATDVETDIYPRLVVNTGMVAARTATMHWAEHPDQDLTALVDAAMDAIRRGLPRPTTPTPTPAPAPPPLPGAPS